MQLLNKEISLLATVIALVRLTAKRARVSVLTRRARDKIAQADDDGGGRENTADLIRDCKM